MSPALTPARRTSAPLEDGRAIVLTNPDRIEAFLRSDPVRHVYALGDLDPFFWPRTRWWGWEADGELRAVCLRYDGLHTPTVLAFGEDLPPLAALVEVVIPSLPREVYLHLEPGLAPHFEGRFTLSAAGEYRRMTLARPDAITNSERDPGVTWIGPADADELLAFYARAFPGNWFDPRMLETGRYAVYRHAGRIAAVAGVHVWSVEREVAALGNIATAPEHRGRGWAAAVTTAVCRRLLDDGCAIGLNVASTNVTAIRLYERLGFTTWSVLEEFSARHP